MGRIGDDTGNRREVTAQPAGALGFPARFAAVLLAGGGGRRLGGTDKPGVLVGGQTLVARVAAAALRAGACRVVVVGPPRPGLTAAALTGGHRRPGGPPEGEPVVEFTSEQPPGSGPVPALRAGLGLVAEPWLLLLAADLPFVREDHLRALLAAAASGGTGPGSTGPGSRGGAPAVAAVLADDQGRIQWLTSCWRTARLRAALAGYGGNSLHGVLAPLRPETVAIAAHAGQPPPWFDCDTPEDVAAARTWAQAGQAD